jgi:hypothetical protein
MTLLAWYDAPVALAAALFFVLAVQDHLRGKRLHERRQKLLAEQILRADEDNAYFWARQAAVLAERQAGAQLVELCEPYGFSIRVPAPTRVLRKV